MGPPGDTGSKGTEVSVAFKNEVSWNCTSNLRNKKDGIFTWLRWFRNRENRYKLWMIGRCIQGNHSLIRLRVVPHFSSRGVIFTPSRVSLGLLSLRKNGGLLVVYSPIIGIACPPKRSQKSLGRNLVPIPFKFLEWGLLVALETI